MRSYWILFALAAAIGISKIAGLKLVNNGYEDLYIVIGETVPEYDVLLDRIKVFSVTLTDYYFTSKLSKINK